MSKKKLVIVESPAKSKTIEKYLGKDYRVLSSIGHVRDLPKSNKDALDIEKGFIPKYVNSPGKEKIIKSLQANAKNSDLVLLASDPDREGEAIAWHVSELLKPYNKNIKRVSFNEITKEAVEEAISHPREIDLNLKEAQEARRVLDRLVGYDLSGLIWKKVRYGLSAGRVQSPALRILMEREREIRAFKSEPYFILTANLKNNQEIITFTCTKEPKEKEVAKDIKNIGEKHGWLITNLKETEIKRTPKPPFITSTLQQTASTRLGFTPSRTMGVAQKLYEAGHITYMRTDSLTLSKQAQKQILAIINKDFGDNYIQSRQYKTKNKSAQEAHEAIRPTNFNHRSVGKTVDQKALYKLIWERTMASQMSDAILRRTKLTANIDNNDNSKPIPDFTLTASRVIFDGWLKVDVGAKGEDTFIPKLNKNDKLTCQSVEIESKETQPPNRYTEAGLIKELEKRGIGRPSTYASIMNTIVQRGYVTKEGRTLIPTDTGDVVSTFLEQHFDKYISDDFTSEMESELDEIAIGKRGYKRTLKDFYTDFKKDVDSKSDIDKLTNLGPAPKEFTCPKCKSEMVKKLGKNGTFLSCAKFPDCDGARLIDGSELKPEEPIGTHPETEEPIYVLKGRFGSYVQQGKSPEKGKRGPKPHRATLPPGIEPKDVTLEKALHYLKLPRELGLHPKTNEPVVANTGQYGPYIAHAGDFRSLKDAKDNPYDITFERALEILAQPKTLRKGEKMIKELGIHPKTRKLINVYESKSGRYLKKGFKRISIPDEVKTEDITIDLAVELLKQ